MPLVLRRVQYSTLTELDTLLDGVFEDGLPLNFTSLCSLHPEQKLTVAHYQKRSNIEADISSLYRIRDVLYSVFIRLSKTAAQLSYNKQVK